MSDVQPTLVQTTNKRRRSIDDKQPIVIVIDGDGDDPDDMPVVVGNSCNAAANKATKKAYATALRKVQRAENEAVHARLDAEIAAYNVEAANHRVQELIHQAANLLIPGQTIPTDNASERKAFTAEQRTMMCNRQRNRCAYCRQDLPPEYHVDHTRALCDGGRHTTENACATCPNCHAIKNRIEARNRTTGVQPLPLTSAEETRLVAGRRQKSRKRTYLEAVMSTKRLDCPRIRNLPQYNSKTAIGDEKAFNDVQTINETDQIVMIPSPVATQEIAAEPTTIEPVAELRKEADCEDIGTPNQHSATDIEAIIRIPRANRTVVQIEALEENARQIERRKKIAAGLDPDDPDAWRYHLYN